MPTMRALASTIKEAVLLTRRSGRFVVCLDLVEAAHTVRLSYECGHVLPINAGAAAEVLLAWAPPQEVATVLAAAPLERFTVKTITEPALLQACFAQIRKQEVAVSQGSSTSRFWASLPPSATREAVSWRLSVLRPWLRASRAVG
jgi:DNA-binding IclR family transcriptional regulator